MAQHHSSTAASGSGGAGVMVALSRVPSMNAQVAFPMKAVSTVAIAITSLVSFVPAWKLYFPGLWFSKVRPDLFWWSGSVATIDSSTSVVVAAAAYNEVNDPTERRRLAHESRPLVFGNTRESSERRVCELVNSRGQTLFTQSWMPTTRPTGIRKLKGLVILLHGLNEHSGRYAYFASKLNDQGYGAYAMDWLGHGGSDGLHGYVDSLDQVVLDAKLYWKQVTAEHPNVPVFLFGHSTGGAIALKASLLASDEEMFKGIILTAPAVQVKPAHPIIAVVAPLFSILFPKYQFRGATRPGAAVSRDPLALIAKYSDPLVYTGPIRIRTGTEILRLGAFLQKNFQKVTAPFLVLHGSQDQVTDPKGSQDLYQQASSGQKSIQIYEGLLHDLLFELEKDAITMDIIHWLDNTLEHS